MDISNVVNFLKILSWTKLVQLFIATVLLLAAYAFWENRAIIYNSLRVGAKVETNDALILAISETTKSSIANSVDKSKSIVAGIQVVNVDFKKNIRSTAHFESSSAAIRESFDKFQTGRMTDVPLFTNNEDSNQKLINLINGEFVCLEFKNSSEFLYFTQQSGQPILMVCAVSIPPYYGRFSGYMNIYLYKTPSTDELSLVRQLSRDISLKVYENDVERSARN